MAPIFIMEIFFVDATFCKSLKFVRNFKLQKFLHILEEQTQNKHKKFCCQKTKFKMLVKITNHIFSKKKIEAVPDTQVL
jgi:hypothetical protein